MQQSSTKYEGEPSLLPINDESSCSSKEIIEGIEDVEDVVDLSVGLQFIFLDETGSSASSPLK